MSTFHLSTLMTRRTGRLQPQGKKTSFNYMHVMIAIVPIYLSKVKVTSLACGEQNFAVANYNSHFDVDRMRTHTTANRILLTNRIPCTVMVGCCRACSGSCTSRSMYMYYQQPTFIVTITGSLSVYFKVPVPAL